MAAARSNKTVRKYGRKIVKRFRRGYWPSVMAVEADIL